MDDVTRRSLESRQVVLVLQGGGALGAYQAGVYQGLHEAGVEPHWIVGTSIGAINAALIAGNVRDARIDKLNAFWTRVRGKRLMDERYFSEFANGLTYLNTLTRGVPGFFEVNPLAALGLQTEVGVEHAAFYSTDPLRQTLHELVDFEEMKASDIRLTVGAVNVLSGTMRYFDSRHMPLRLEHVMASGALPPGFPAIDVDGHPYWDGGIYSNTPVEVVIDDDPRRDSLIFTVNVWQPRGVAPQSIWDVLGRQKDIQYASRINSHLWRQQQIHRLRHIIRDLADRLPAADRADPNVREMIAYGCHTTMHIVTLLAPRLPGEDCTKDVDFSEAGITARWEAGYADAQQALAEQCWLGESDPLAGVVVHEPRSR